MKKLKVERYKQKPGHCSIASAATIAHFHNAEINYDKTQKNAIKNVSPDIDNGLDSGEIGTLLNYLGFNKVTVVSTNLNFLDYSWANLSKSRLIHQLDHMQKSYRGEYRSVCQSLCKWLQLYTFDNNLIIDYDFSKYIKKTIDSGKPLILSFNWTMYFRYTKQGEKKIDPIKGECEEHAVVAYGYNKKGVHICDSHHQHYKYKLKAYKTGFYIIPWEHLMTIMGWGDLFIPENYE